MVSVGAKVKTTPAIGDTRVAAPVELNLADAQKAVASKHLLSVRRANDPGQVKELKALLHAKGYDVGEVGDKDPGVFDKKVLAAVAEFQADNNLTKDGVVGQQTWTALLDVPGAAQVPPGNAWLVDWARLLESRGDAFVPTEAPPDIDLRADLGPRNATDGVPMFSQGDPRWGGRIMRSSSVLQARGCAVSSMAMALSGATGKEINPGQLDAYLDKHGGYDRKNNLQWAVAGQAVGMKASRVTRATLTDIENKLAANRPVVLGVDYKAKDKDKPGAEHWITVTGTAMDTKGQKVFLANDPATGGVIRLYPNKQGGLNSYDGGMGDYRSTGDAVYLG